MIEPRDPPVQSTSRPGWLRYGTAVGVTLAAWLLRLSLTPLVGETAVPFITFFPAVAAAAWIGGTGPAGLTAVLSMLFSIWSFVEPVHSLAIAERRDVAALGAFAVSAAVILAAIGSMHSARARLLRVLEERRRAERALAESRDLLDTTLSSIGDAVIVTDARGAITFMNREAERLTRWSSAEARGQPLPAVFRIVAEATRAPVADPAARALEQGAAVGLANHTLLIAKDGTEIPINDSAAPVREPGGPVFGVVLVFRDATAEREAQLARAHIASIVEFSGDAILTKNLDGIIQSWNKSAERMFGYTGEEAIGKPVTLLIPEDRLEEEPRILARLRRGLPFERLETVRRAKDGRMLHVSVSVSPLKDADGRVVGASKI